MAIVDVAVTRVRVRGCSCGFWCDDNFDTIFRIDREWPDQWADHLLVHEDASAVFRWRGDFEVRLTPCLEEASTGRSALTGT